MIFLCAICIAPVVYGQAVFTADYYLANPDAYLGKEVTLSVSSLNPCNEQQRDAAGSRHTEPQRTEHSRVQYANAYSRST